MSILRFKATGAERMRAELPARSILRPERPALDAPAAMVSSSEVLGSRKCSHSLDTGTAWCASAASIAGCERLVTMP
jgi:hypothetical protein